MRITTAGFLLSTLCAAVGCQRLSPVHSASDNGTTVTPGVEATVATGDDYDLSRQTLEPVLGTRVSDRFPNIELLDQHGRRHHFYDDLVCDKTVCIVFFYTRCTGSCPGTTVALERLRHELKDEFAPGDLRFISLTLEPDVDTPEELQAYMDRYQLDPDPSLPEWFYCTGDFEEVDHLRRSLGVYDLDPEIDADKTEHAAIVTFGNDRLNRWAALPTGLKMSDLSETVLRIAGNSQRQRYTTILTMMNKTTDTSQDSAVPDSASCCTADGNAACEDTQSSTVDEQD